MLCVTFAAAAIALSAPMDVREVPVHHRRASLIAERIKPLFKDAKLKAHDRRGVIEVTSSAAEVADAERAIPMFDIRPIMLAVDIELVSLYDKLEAWYQVQIENVQTWELHLKNEKIRFTLTPRINDDRSITLNVSANVPGWEGTAVARVKSGEPFILDIDRIVRERRDAEPTIIPADTGILIRIQPSWPRTAAPKDDPPKAASCSQPE